MRRNDRAYYDENVRQQGGAGSYSYPASDSGTSTVTQKNYIHKLRPVHYLVIAIALYLLTTVYNGIQTDKAFDEVNAFSSKILGYEVLIDKGVLGHSWHYITHPQDNFNELLRNQAERISYASLEGLGVWSLADYSAYNSNPVISQDTFSNSVGLFEINNLEFTSIERNPLWSEVTFAFDFKSNPSLDEHRDNTGKVGISGYFEYYKDDNSIDVGSYFGVDILRDDKYSTTILLDPGFELDRLISITFEVWGSDFYLKKTFSY